MESITVFSTTDPGLVAMVKSLLDSAGIEHVAQGEFLQNLFPLNIANGPVRFQVSPKDAERARVLLAQLKQ